ncbi:MAG: hypothetical protein LBL46_03930 [Rickettsiales bacterium]|jgi:hypothetical protein|nr:hypothetical protein [Rickettsiales bacterium]
MLKSIGVFAAVFALAFLPSVGAAAKCKISDLQKCLDSACYDELDAGSRCYMCGTSAAKKPEKEKYALGDTPEMQTLAVGKSSKNTLSDKELKKAPTDPGSRYQWATDECLAKLKDCDAEEVADNYDKLIDASCKIAMGESEYAESMKKAAVKKTRENCQAEMNVCVLADKRCGGNMLKCETDEVFNREVSACLVEVSGCGDFMTDLRNFAKRTRDDMVKKNESRLADLILLRQNERKNKMEMAQRLCGGGGKDGCIMEICGNLPTGLDENGQCGAAEKIWANAFCKFVDVACDKLK